MQASELCETAAKQLLNKMAGDAGTANLIEKGDDDWWS